MTKKAREEEFIAWYEAASQERKWQFVEDMTAHARIHLAAARELSSQSRVESKGSTPIGATGFTVPSFILAALSAELGLKALLLILGLHKPWELHTHDLLNLANKLPVVDRAAIESECPLGTLERLEKGDSRKPFEDWRYSYEQERTSGVLQHLVALASAAINRVETQLVRARSA